MRHGLSKKNGMPKKHDPKKIGAHEGPMLKTKFEHMKVQEKERREIYNNIAMSSCYPSKGERDS